MGLAVIGAGRADALDVRACNGPEEAACMLEAIWMAASVLPPEKQARLAQLLHGDDFRNLQTALRLLHRPTEPRQPACEARVRPSIC